MELIQPFINAADAVFAEALQAPTKIADLSMDEDTYRRKGVAALIAIKGDIEGRVILDLAPDVAMRVAKPTRRRSLARKRASHPRNRLRTRQHGHRQQRHPSHDQGVPLQSFSAGNSTSANKASAAARTEAMVLCIETLAAKST